MTNNLGIPEHVLQFAKAIMPEEELEQAIKTLSGYSAEQWQNLLKQAQAMPENERQKYLTPKK